eukprot:scaffold9759_cov126-Isochrysis_galbana.AAC.1
MEKTADATISGPSRSTVGSRTWNWAEASLCNGTGTGREDGWIRQLRVKANGAAIDDGGGGGNAIHIYGPKIIGAHSEAEASAQFQTRDPNVERVGLVNRYSQPQPHSQAFAGSIPSRQSGMVQPVVEDMLATVHAAGSSLFGLFSSCTTFDSTIPHLR